MPKCEIDYEQTLAQRDDASRANFQQKIMRGLRIAVSFY